MRIKINKSLLIIGLVGLTAACGSKEEDKKAGGPPPTMTVEVVELKAAEVANVISVPGSVIPGEQVDIFSEVSGRIERINFKEGQTVPKGAVLLQVDTDILKAQRGELTVNLKLAQKDEARKKTLLNGKGISLEEYEKAESQLENIKAQIDLINVQISKATVRAPFSGRIGLRQVSVGAFISPTTLISTLVQENPVKIEFSVAERYASNVKTGQTINFHTQSGTEKYTAKVYAFQPKVDEGTRMLKVRAEMKNNGKLIPGIFVAIDYDLGFEQNAFLVPAESVIPILNGQKVYVVRNGIVVEVPVEIGVRTADDVQIIGDLENGDKVLISGLLAVKAGVPVKTKLVK